MLDKFSYTLFKYPEKVWGMNRSAKGSLIVTTTLVWLNADNSLNMPNLLLTKLSRYMVLQVLSSRNSLNLMAYAYMTHENSVISPRLCCMNMPYNLSSWG